VLSVVEVLALPVLARGVPEVVAGAGSLDRSIRWVHSGEIPNMSEMLKGGELLLITGIGLSESEREQRRYVADLSERGIAALVVELGTRFRQTPRAMAAEAERLGLPVVVLHRQIPFVEVTEVVLRELFGRQLELLRRGEDVHQRFVSLLLRGAGIPEILDELARTVANPVILEKTGQGILYHASAGVGEADVLASWEALARGLPSAPASTIQEVPVAAGERWGRLVVLAVGNELDRYTTVAVERAVALVALALVRDRAEEVATGRERGDFFRRLLAGGQSESDLRQRASSLGLTAPLLLPFAIGPSPLASAAALRGDDAAWRRIYRDLQTELRSRRLPVLGASRDHERELLMVVGLRDEAARAEIAELVADTLGGLAMRQLGGDHAALVCVGSAARSWSATGDSLRIAVDGLASAGLAPRRRWHDTTVPSLDGLVWSLRDLPNVVRFADDRLRPLVEHDNDRGTAKLLPTLAAFCEHAGRKSDTARALHIERQSLYHRLARIERLLEVDLSDPPTLLALHMALTVHGYRSAAQGR
jgi:purine catabolism regulator